MSKRNRITLVVLIVPLFISHASGSCVERKPFEKTIIVDECEVVDPLKVSMLNDLANKRSQGSAEPYRDTRESYRGAVLVEKQGSKIEKFFVSSKDKKGL